VVRALFRSLLSCLLISSMLISSVLLGAACKSDETTEPTPPPPACTCEENEDCQACYEHIGECCYADATIGGRVELMTANCQRDGRCASCCNECVTKSCDQLLAEHLCPNGELAQ
jgi:hypothetical protein